MSDQLHSDLSERALLRMTAEIVSAYVSNNTVVANDLANVIHNVFDALSKASSASGVLSAWQPMEPDMMFCSPFRPPLP